MNKTSFLLYQPILDYEESIEPYLICSTLKKAEKIKKEILDFYDGLIKTVPDEPEQDSEEWFVWMDKRDIILQPIKNPPYDIRLRFTDLCDESKEYGINQGLISIMELPLL
jgi:hypothetical protein